MCDTTLVRKQNKNCIISRNSWHCGLLFFGVRSFTRNLPFMLPCSDTDNLLSTADRQQMYMEFNLMESKINMSHHPSWKGHLEGCAIVPSSVSGFSSAKFCFHFVWLFYPGNGGCTVPPIYKLLWHVYCKLYFQSLLPAVFGCCSVLLIALLSL